MRDLLSAQIGVKLEKPKHLSSANWDAIAKEYERLTRAESADDLGDIIGQCKCLVESVSRVALELDGRPPPSNASYSEVAKDAHELLIDVKTEGKHVESAGRTASTQMSKIARSLGEYRNSNGSGHGRAFLPEIREDTASAIASSALLWVHWALPRLGAFAYGRPKTLIHDLIIDNEVFYRGSLTRRLKDADLPRMQPNHQREVGVAVARRSMQGTFVVAEDGVESCADSNSLEFWSEQYRLGIVRGLFTDKNGDITITKWGVHNALLVLAPVAEIAEEVRDVSNLVLTAGLPAKLALSSEEKSQLTDTFNHVESARSGDDLLSIRSLRDTLGIPPF